VTIATTRRQLLVLMGAAAGSRISPSWATEGVDIAPQPYFAEINRAVEALAQLGTPIAAADATRIAALARQHDRAAVEAAETILGRYTLARLSIDSGGGAHVVPGDAQRTLVEQGWRMFLVRISNPGARTDSINFSTGWYYAATPARMMPGTGGFNLAQRAFLLDTLNNAALIENMWLQAQLHGATPAMVYGMDVQLVALSGFAVEYRVVQLFSRDHGRRSAALSLTAFAKNAGAGDSTSRTFDFECLPSRVVTLGVKDVDDRGCVAALTIKDKLGHIYPPLAMRLAPDMFFQEQVYRADGETMRLPDGEFLVRSTRGPEYLPGEQILRIDSTRTRIDVTLQRWIDPAKWGWYSGDPHIHAGGCLHYQVPTEGVSPETMIRHVRGEGLAIGDVLSWGPSWYYQKQFFSGHATSPAAVLEHPQLQNANNATLQPRATPKDAESSLRYDVEVSGFPSSHAGHLVLLRLREQDFPGTRQIEDWPSWNLPILQWARAQGAVAGYAHCGLGMVVESKDLPNHEIPPMNGVGTQEAIVDVTHGLVDFLAGCDTTPVAELNAWYHMLNCGFRLALVGETDYPCLSGERVGVGRTYVKLDRRPLGEAGYEAWVRNLQKGRLYCGDGRSHFLEFTANGRASGDADVEIALPGKIEIKAIVSARLEPQITPETEALRATQSGDWAWGWHLEKARIGNTREVMVELVINGIAVQRAAIEADGMPRPLQFNTAITRSSWVALRIMPSGHTYPIFVAVGRMPIRASKKSAQWCRDCVDKLWEVKSAFIRESERGSAAAAFEHARRTYETIIRECDLA
jgi:hypothetical protein